MTRKTARRIIPFVSVAVVALGTYLAIQIGKGYRPTSDGLSGTGLLAVTSSPEGAEVYLNDRLTTATDDTINLPPGQYSVTVKTEGFIPWNKTLEIKQELVTQANANLYRAAPSLTPLTLTGATNIHPSPDGHKVVYVVASASAAPKNGLYLLELDNSQRAPRQILRSATQNLMDAEILWSPDSTQLLLHTTTETSENHHLVSTESITDFELLTDVTARLPIILSEWEEDLATLETRLLSLLPPEVQYIATSSAVNLYFSPDEKKIMYVATASATIDDHLVTPPLVTNTQSQTRDIEPNNLYVYDLVEDRNYHIDEITLNPDKPLKELLLLSDYQHPTVTTGTSLTITPSVPITSYNKLQQSTDFHTMATNFRAHYYALNTMPFQWFPDSTHLLIQLEDKIDLIEYDSTNWITLYSGPFEDHFLYPWPNSSRIMVLTNLNPSSDVPPNLYAIDIK